MTLIDRPSGLAGRLALGVATVVMIAACSGKGPGASPTAAPATQAPASAAPASMEPSAAASEGAAGGVYEVKVATGSVGKFLTGEDDKTLYIFKKDTTPGKSTCNGDCATNWPPFVLDTGETTKAGAGVTGALATIKRDDGTDQVTYNGAPLYYFAADKKAGDTNGQGVGGVWFVAAP
jgi:predicted lipoprotein with Yx(FWY)xxD motif